MSAMPCAVTLDLARHERAIDAREALELERERREEEGQREVRAAARGNNRAGLRAVLDDWMETVGDTDKILDVMVAAICCEARGQRCGAVFSFAEDVAVWNGERLAKGVAL